MDELRTSEFEEDGVGLVGARARQQRFARSWRAVQQHAFGGFDPNGVEHVLVRHGENDRFDEFLDLLVGTTNVGIFLGRTFVDFHRLDARIEFGREFFQDEVRIFVGPDQIARTQRRWVDQSRNGQKDGLTGAGPNHCRPSLAGGIDVGRLAAFRFFLFQAWWWRSVCQRGSKQKEAGW